MKKTSLLVFASLLAISCVSFLFFFRTRPVSFRTVDIKNKMRLSVPDYLTQADSLDPSALIQFHNPAENILLAVYEVQDTTHEPVPAYFRKRANRLLTELDEPALLKYYPDTIHSLAACIGNIRGSVNGTNVYYKMAVIRTPFGYWEILFGAGDSNQSRYEEDMNAVIHSIHQL